MTNDFGRVIIIFQVFTQALHICIAAKDICPSSYCEFHLSSFSSHFIEDYDNLRQVYHASFFHAMASRRELWILVPPQLDSSDPQISCGEAWYNCLLHVDSNVHLEQNVASTCTCHLAVTHRSSLRSRSLFYTAGYSQQQLGRIVSLAMLGNWTSRCCPVYAALTRFLLCVMLYLWMLY